MSIATDEALKAEDSVLERELNGTSWLIGFERGYIAGRTAEPTEAEIEAAAKRIFIFTNGPWQGEHYELSHVDGLAIADAAWEMADKRLYEACAEFALQDARKAVTE